MKTLDSRFTPEYSQVERFQMTSDKEAKYPEGVYLRKSSRVFSGVGMVYRVEQVGLSADGEPLRSRHAALTNFGLEGICTDYCEPLTHKDLERYCWVTPIEAVVPLSTVVPR